MLHINDLTFRFGSRILFEGATAFVPAGQRVGLIGRNGIGKTTLFGLIEGRLQPQAGNISVTPRARIGSLAQDPPAGDMPVVDWVLSADTERHDLLTELDTTGDGNRIAEIHERLLAIDAHAAPARAASILSGLGFDWDAQQRPVSTFSGGWRMRIALAAILLQAPDLLLLDEPTNHLDLEAALWLQGYLAQYPGTLIVISHDRELLNIVPERILLLSDGRLQSYQGGFDRFESTRRAQIERAAKLAERQLVQRRRLEGFIERFRAKATKAKQAQSRIKMLERMPPVQAVVEPKTPHFDFPDPDPLSPPLIAIENGSAGYDGRPVLNRLNLRIDMDDRIALLGANGNGKSTLAKVLSGAMPLLDGRLQKSGKLVTGYMAQDQADLLAPGQTPFEYLRALDPMRTETALRSHLGRFDISGPLADTRIADLSGGETARLLIALMCRKAPHILILDEPTNHLDIDSRAALLAALNAFDGAVVLVSHDSFLVERAADRLWLVEDGAVRPFDGDFSAYRAHLADRRRQTGTGDSGPESRPGHDRRKQRQANAAQRAALAPLRRAVASAEKDMETLAARRDTLSGRLADPTLYEGDTGRLTALQKDLGQTEKALVAAEARWLAAMEDLERAEAAAEAEATANPAAH